MTIALDATYSVGRDLSGVGVYSREILSGLAAAHPESRFLFCYRSHRLFRGFREPLPPNARRRLLTLAGPGAEIFHGLNQRMDTRRFRHGVSTFHDLFVMTSDYSTPEFRRKFTHLAHVALERSSLVIAVSEFTARQVVEQFGYERSRIRVVPHGVRFPVNPKPAERQPIILNVGAIQKRKNITRLIEAFERAGSGWRLQLAGSVGYGGEEALERVGNSPVRDRIEVLGYVSAEKLAELYSTASIFAFPSLDEGFGIPVLEAMACGVPVITSNRSALPEVAGAAALQVDPRETDQIAQAMDQFMRSESLRDEYRKRGFQRAAEFTWQDAVAKTWEVYRELLG